MSADNFQTKYSSVMESMLKAAIAETTKLFETMVDELKAEISNMKKENEELKTRCCQFASERNQPTVCIISGERELLPGPSDGTEQRDQAIQCDLVPFRMMQVEQCQPLNHLEIDNTLHDHNYGEGATQMAVIVVKQEDSDDSSSHSVMKQEEVEPMEVCGQVSGDQPDPPQASACATETEGHPINQESSTGVITMPQKETPVSLEQPYLGSDRGLQGAQNQLPILVPSIVFSLASLNNNIEEESEASQKISTTQEELLTSEKHLSVVAHNVVNQQCPKEGKTSVNEQADVILNYAGKQFAKCKQLNEEEALEKSKSGEGEGHPQPELSGRRRRGRPPKQAKCQQQPMEENGSPAVSVPSVAIRCSSRKGRTSKPKQLSMEKEKMSIQTPSTKSLSLIETLNPPEGESRERFSSVTLQDAMLLVEAMNQSTVAMAAPAKPQSASHVSILQTVVEVPTEPQTPPLHVEMRKAAGNLPITELSTKDQSTIEKQNYCSVNSDTSPSNVLQSNIDFVIPKQQHKVIPSKPTTALIPSTDVAVQSILWALQDQPFASPLSVATSKPLKAVSRKIIAMPRSVSLLKPPKIGALSPSQLPAVVSKVVAAQKKSIIPDSLTAGLPLGTPFKASVPQKIIDAASMKLFSADPSQSTTTSKEPLSGPPQQPKLTIIIPRKVSALASRKFNSQTIAVKTMQGTAKSDAPVTLSSPNLISPSQELRIIVSPQIASDEKTKVLFQNKSETSEPILECPQQNVSVSELMKAHTENVPSSNTSMGPVPPSVTPVRTQIVAPKFSAVVRLTRLSFPISAKEAVKVSRLPTDGSSENLKEGITKEKPSPMVISTQPSKTLVSSTELCPSLKETPVVLPVNTSQMTEQPKVIQEKVSLSSEGSTPVKVSTPNFENSTLAINTTKPRIVSGGVGLPTSNEDKDIIEFGEQELASPNDQPTKKKSSAAIIHLTPITTKDMPSPHSQMTKAQFLAQLAVKPITEDPTKASSNYSMDATASNADTRTGVKKRLQKKSILAKRQSHLKTQITKNVTSPTKTTDHPVPLSPRRSRQSGVGCKRTVSDPPVNSKRFKATRESTPLSPRSTVDVVSTTEQPTSLSPRRSNFTKQNASSKKAKSTSVSPRRSTLSKQSASSKKVKSTKMSPRESISIKESASPQKTKSTSASPRRGSSSHESDSSKKTESISLRPGRISSTRDCTSSKSSKTTCVDPKGTSPKVIFKESPSFCRRKCTLPKDLTSSALTKGETSSFNPGYRITSDEARTKNVKLNPGSPSIRWPKLAKGGVSPKSKRKSTVVKNNRLSPDVTGPEKNLRVVNGNKLSKATKAKTMAKMRLSSQSKLQNVAKTSQSAENSDAEKKITAKAIWTPPTVLANKKPPTGVKKDTKSPGSLNQSLVFPPSVSLFPIPVRGPPVISPLQPLSVIGRRLLKNQCGQCGRVLSSVAALESHVRLHTGRRPFSCTLCGKGFTDSKGLKRHGRVHRNGRIHVCPQCGKGFVYSFGLTKHLKMVHRRIKPFICQICNKGFFTKRDVEAHLRMHTGEKPFHCNLCEKKFARRVELNMHLRWHNGEKRHWCSYCGKGFLDCNNLKRHKYIHTGEKPHSCPQCPKSFTQSAHLKKHVKNVHKIP